MKSKTKKILIGCSGIIIFAIFAVIGISLYICSAVFDDAPVPVVIRTPDYKNLKSATDKITEVLSMNPEKGGGGGNIDLDSLGLGDVDLENLDAENLDLGELLKKVDLGKAMNALSQPGALVGTLTFTKGEVNAMIDAALAADQVERKASGGSTDRDVKIYDAFFDNGRLTLKFSVESDFSTPFGRYCNIEMVFTPQVLDHHLKLDLYSTRVGTVSVPVSYFKKSIDSQLKLYEQTDDGKSILAIITSLKVDNDNVELKYDLQGLSVFILDKLPEIQKINSSPDKTSAVLELFK